MKRENVIRIIAVFLAGAKNKVLWLEKDVSERFYWVAWPPMKWNLLRITRKMLGFKVVKLDELRIESNVRLDRAVKIANAYAFDEVFIPASYSPKRKKEGKKEIEQLAIECLTRKGIPKEKISTWGNAVRIANKAEIIAKHIYTLIARDPGMQAVLHLPVMDYNAERLLDDIRKEFDRLGISRNVKIIESIILRFEIPNFEEAMRGEMRFNLWAEKLKTRIEKIPWLARLIERMERKGREKV